MKSLIALIKAIMAALTLDDAKRKELEQQVAQLEAETNKPTPTSTPPTQQASTAAVALPAEVLAALEEVKTLKEMLLKQEERATAAEKAMQDKLAADKKKQVEDYIKSVTEGENIRVTPAEMKEKWQPLLEANFDATKKVIDAMPVHPASKKTSSKPADKKSEQPSNDYVVNRRGYLEAAAAELAEGPTS